MREITYTCDVCKLATTKRMESYETEIGLENLDIIKGEIADSKHRTNNKPILAFQSKTLCPDCIVKMKDSIIYYLKNSEFWDIYGDDLSDEELFKVKKD